MELRERLETLEAGYELLINAPTITYMMTGASMVCIRKSGEVCVTYQDGKNETRMATDAILDAVDIENLCLIQLVGFVQDGPML